MFRQYTTIASRRCAHSAAPKLRSAAFSKIAARLGRTPAQVVFRFAIQIGIVPLTGTANPAHMREDLAVETFELEEEEVARIEGLAG